MDDDQIYKRKIERRRIISNMLEKGNAREDPLSKNNRENRKLYRKQLSMCNLPSAKLRI